MSDVPLPLRYVAAIGAATVVASGTFAGLTAFEDALTGSNHYFEPPELLLVTFFYSFMLSLPVVAIALPLCAALVNRLTGPQPTARRTLAALVIGTTGGAAICLVLMPFTGFDAWQFVASGAWWGLVAAAAGLIILPPPSAGAPYG